MAEPSNLSLQQVADAIRAGLERGTSSRLNYRRRKRPRSRRSNHGNLAHYRDHVQKNLDEGDFVQAAEKSWGAYAQAIKAVAANHGLRVTHHASIIGAADRIALLVRSSDTVAGDTLRHGLSTARSLHQHFYENDLSRRHAGHDLP